MRPLIGHLATVRPDGDPTVTPLWYEWDGEVIRLTTTVNRAKYHNIRRVPRVAMSIVDPDRRTHYLQVRAHVSEIEPDIDGSFYERIARRYGIAIPATPADAGDRVVLVLRPVGFSHQA